MAKNGERVKIPGNPAVYLVDNDRKRHIPNEATYHNLFASWGYNEDAKFGIVPDGLPLSDGALLVQNKPHPAIYLIDLGTKRHIKSESAMHRFHFSFAKAVDLPASVIEAIPNGAPIE